MADVAAPATVGGLSAWVQTQGGPAAPNINWRAPETRQRALELARELRQTHGKEWRTIQPGTHSEQARAMQFIMNTLEGAGTLKLDGTIGSRSAPALARAQRAFGVVADRAGGRDTIDGMVARLRDPNAAPIASTSTPRPMSPREVRSARQSREVIAARERNRVAAEAPDAAAAAPRDQQPEVRRTEPGGPAARPVEARPAGALSGDDVSRRIVDASAMPSTSSMARARALKALGDDIARAPEADRPALQARLAAQLAAGDPETSRVNIANYLAANRGSDQSEVIKGVLSGLRVNQPALDTIQSYIANNAFRGLSSQALDTLAGERPVPTGDRNVDENRLNTWGNLHMRAINQRVENGEPLSLADREFLTRERPSIAADVLRRAITAPDADH